MNAWLDDNWQLINWLLHSAVKEFILEILCICDILSILNIGVQIYEGNLHDRYIIEYIFKHNKLSGVVHLAGYTSISGSNENPIKSIEDNTENMALLLDVLKIYKVWLIL